MGWHAWTAIRLGLRRRSLLLLVILGVLVLSGAALAAGFSGRQPATLALDMALSVFRLIGVALALLWTQELFTRDLERGTLATALSFPLPRSHFALGRFLGVAGLLALTLALYGSLIGLAGWLGGMGYNQPNPANNGWALMPVLGFLWVDLVTITAFTWLIATVATTPLLPLGLGLAFAWAGRTLGPVLGYLAAQEQESRTTGFLDILSPLQWGLPGLHRLDIRDGLLYGHWPPAAEMAAALANCGGFAVLLMALAVWQFNRRELG